MSDKTNDSSTNTAAKLISLVEAAAISGFSTGYLRRLMREGKLQGTKIGRDWLTTEQAVKEYLSTERRRGPKPKND
jgi:excisionase family DNA binding protein